MTVQELHLKAIELADNAFILKFRDNLEAATKQFVAAFQLEKQAALLAQEQSIGEPTISVLFKSAASLAINANELNEAEKLICLALCGEPPVDIAEELRNILEELYFQRHLKLQGIQLNTTEIQLVIAGRGIGYGMAKTDLVFDKLSTFEKLTLRTAVEWLVEKIQQANPTFKFDALIREAIKMEKEQMNNFFKNGIEYGFDSYHANELAEEPTRPNFEQYYKETFKSE